MNIFTELIFLFPQARFNQHMWFPTGQELPRGYLMDTSEMVSQEEQQPAMLPASARAVMRRDNLAGLVLDLSYVIVEPGPAPGLSCRYRIHVFHSSSCCLICPPFIIWHQY